MKKITVCASREYDILVGAGLLSRVGEEIVSRIPVCKAVIVTDSQVAPLYGKVLRESLEASGFEVDTFVFGAGEQSKNMETLGDMLEFLAALQMTRKDLIVALGGGVVGDMAGFCAAVYQRGIAFVQIPTTLLAAVDSSVGGKTAIDLKAGKNLAGAFHQPSLVICDTKTLDTLSEEIFRDGIAEVLKYGVIGNVPLFEKIAEGNFREDIESIIEDCISMKRDIVMRDEFDNGERQLLNLGHTLGHAIEKNSDFTISHGRSVAMGMYLIALAAEERGIAEEGSAQKIKLALENNGLPTMTMYTAQEITQSALLDKKRRGDSIAFVFPKRIGRCVIEKISADEVQKLVEEAMKAGEKL